MNSTKGPLARQVCRVVLLSGGLLLQSLTADAQNVQHLTTTQPGGMPGRPLVTGIQPGAQSATITWDGPSGYYQLYRKYHLTDSQWQRVGSPTLARRATVSGASAFFTVSGPGPQYAGVHACLECHENIHNTEARTKHAQAFQALKKVHQDKNPLCLPCHTVGYGLPSGFVSEAATPQLAGVQCENCHGPGGNHAANENDPTVRPRVELAATVCGGCHTTGTQAPNYDEWRTSGHAAVVPGALSAMLASTNNVGACGRCHSGSVRHSFVRHQRLPVGDVDVPIVCAVCHDPHQTNANPAQVRYPLASTNDYFLTTTASLAGGFNSKINVCGQCHNHRGASWTNSSAAPHPSLQYNMLLGTVGELSSGARPNRPASHALLITNQCVGCHMQTQPSEGSPFSTNTGHSFSVYTFERCLECHPDPEGLVAFTTDSIATQIEQIKGYLDLWASTKAPLELWARYGVRSWEYTRPGDLSPGGPGPTAAEQSLIPVNIRKARFDVYLVLNDGTYGVHNAPYCATLLRTARDWIQIELNK